MEGHGTFCASERTRLTLKQPSRSRVAQEIAVYNSQTALLVDCMTDNYTSSL